MNTRNFFFVVILLSVFITVGCGNKTNQAGETDATETPIIDNAPYNPDSEAAEEFAQFAISYGKMDKWMAEIALNRSDNPEIDQFATAIIDIQQDAVARLEAIAESKKWEVPEVLIDRHQRKVAQLQNTTDEDFDEEYLRLVINTHTDAIDDFQECLDKEYDPELITYVLNTIPMVRQHLEQGEMLLEETASTES